MKTVVITGANRGIGLAMADKFSNSGYNVIALCRSSSAALEKLQLKIVTGIDVATASGIALLQKKLMGQQIDILINNAGILHNESLGALDTQQILQQFKVNALAPLQVVDVLRSQLVNGAKVALITSRMGSVTDNSSGGYYGYRMAKSALNAAGMSLSRDLAADNISVGLYHPGWVQTEMVGNTGDISATQAAERLVNLIIDQDMSQSGLFKHSNGELLPW
ncbi:MAG: SDR family oxidoreductase [Pseudomonadales bacterium]|nr:SDR family oxidoreductase [Pseudomonadales bacterium]NRA17029.1 SDR family oxidoreductase [Oceanospirillaceae bacterium]